LVERPPISELVRPDPLFPRACASRRLGPARWRWAEASSPRQLWLARRTHLGGAGCVEPKFPRLEAVADRVRRSIGRLETGELSRAPSGGGRLSDYWSFSRGDHPRE